MDRRKRHELMLAERGDGRLTLRMPAECLDKLDRLSIRMGMQRVHVIRHLIVQAEEDRIRRVMAEHGLSRAEAESFKGWPA